MKLLVMTVGVNCGDLSSPRLSLIRLSLRALCTITLSPSSSSCEPSNDDAGDTMIGDMVSALTMCILPSSDTIDIWEGESGGSRKPEREGEEEDVSDCASVCELSSDPAAGRTRVLDAL